MWALVALFFTVKALEMAPKRMPKSKGDYWMAVVMALVLMWTQIVIANGTLVWKI